MKRVRVVLGHKQAEALFDAALLGLADIEDSIETGNYTRADYQAADSALSALARAMRAAKIV